MNNLTTKFIKLIIFLLLFTSNTTSLFGREKKGIFEIKKITGHVYIAHPKRISRINSTSTIIVGETYLTIIESQTDVFMARQLIKEIREKISGLPIRYLIFTHFHVDHILGAGAFLQENPSLVIITHQKSAEHIFLHGPADQNFWLEVVKQQIGSTKDSALITKNEEKRKYFLRISVELEEYYSDIKSSSLTPPNLTFSDSLNLYDKDLRIQLKFLGSGHTPGDIVVLIPQDRVLVTGDLIHDYEPLFWNADPDSWIQVLEKVKQLDFDYFVGGHGDTHNGKIIIESWLNYIKELKVKTNTAIKEGKTLESFLNNITLDSFTSLNNGYGDTIQKFRTSYMDYWTGPLIDALKNEISDVWKFYTNKL